MRRPTMAALAAVAALLTTASACQPDDPDPTGGPETSASSSPDATQTTEPEPTTPEPLDPTTVDLGNRVWTYEDGREGPIEVPLQGGVAEGDWGLVGEGAMTYDETRRVVADMDDDGDQDVVAPLSYDEQTNGYSWTSWFVWLNDGSDLVQLPYAIARDAHCVEIVEGIAPAGDGPGVRIDRLIMELGAECAATPTVQADRTVVVEYDDRGAPWPVQVDPGRFWGGLCVGTSGGTSEGGHEQDMEENGPFDPSAAVVAPGLEPAEAPASEQETQLIDLNSDAWYSELDGWSFTKVVVMYGGVMGTSSADEHCVWTPQG